MEKPNFDLVYDGKVAAKVYLNHVTGKIIGELGYDYPHHRSDKFWDKYTFEPIEGEETMVKPNFNLIYNGQVVEKVYLDHTTGNVTGEDGYKYAYTRSDSFWSGHIFEPISDSDQEPEVKDNVNNPSHYGQGSIEAIDYIEDMLTEEEYVGYLRGNIAKYLHRWRYKNGVEDLKKAQWYLNRLIETQKE